jgi:hypothetical protein
MGSLGLPGGCRGPFAKTAICSATEASTQTASRGHRKVDAWGRVLTVATETKPAIE